MCDVGNNDPEHMALHSSIVDHGFRIASMAHAQFHVVSAHLIARRQLQAFGSQRIDHQSARSQALFADETFRSKSQELLVRVLTHYTQALFAQDQDRKSVV